MWLDSLWRVFLSVRLTIALVVSLSAFCILGSLIAQQGISQVPLNQLYSPETLKWMMVFGLTDVFHSGVFVALLLLLAINLIACSIERLPGVWRQAFHGKAPVLTEDLLERMGQPISKWVFRSFATESSFKTVKEAKMSALLFLEQNGGNVHVVEDHEESFKLLVERGRFSRLGVYITHLSLLLIFAGGLIGALFGFEGGVSIQEGARVSWIQHTRGSKGGLTPVIDQGQVVPGFLNLNFEVECERFTLETYDGQRPKLFKSVLNFYENDVLVHRADISVNSPTEYKGITFYQASYVDEGPGSVDLKVYRSTPNQKRKKALSGVSKSPSLQPEGQMPEIESVERLERVKTGDRYRVDQKAAFKVLQIEKDVMNLGPGARIQYAEGGDLKKSKEFWVFEKLPGFDFAHRGGSKLFFVLEKVNSKYATGLSVAKDPGVWFVWVGSGIFVLALFIALYTAHTRTWISYDPKRGLVLAGWSNKLFLYEGRFEKIAKAFEEQLRTIK